MRKFIVSDLHGCGEVYNSIMGYLDNIALEEEVELYINGDLIDRGLDGYSMLEDVILRVRGLGKVKIHYLGGNHELMMYQALLEREPGGPFYRYSDWMDNGGYIIEGELDLLEDGEAVCEELKIFLGSLKIYHKFSESINGNKLLLVHAQAPEEVLDKCNIKIADNNKIVSEALWTREEIREDFLWFKGPVIGYNRIGLDGYFTIIGHTPVEEYPGFIIKDNYINIDGGCAMYASGYFKNNTVPVVEVVDNHLEILIFNHNNEIVDGYNYDFILSKIDNDELESKRRYLNNQYDNCEEKAKTLIEEIIDIV